MWKTFVFLCVLITYACAPHSPVWAGPPVVFPLENFNTGTIPVNHAGVNYVSQYEGEGGKSNVSLVADAGSGFHLQFEVVAGSLYAQFNAHNLDGTRGFAREYVQNPKSWKFNTINRLSFWMKNPTNGSPLRTDGNFSLQMGTYVKRVTNADPMSDETGGNHWYHLANIPNTNTWTKIILNTHPHHVRGGVGSEEHGNQLHPTGEAGYNYFDALTRFYINETVQKFIDTPIIYQIDQFDYFQEPNPENDDQIYTIAATFVPAENRFILTWSRNKNEDAVKHEVRYSSRNIHEIGWAAATPAPLGIITPPGTAGYNGMVYSTTAIKFDQNIYFAIKPQNSKRFSQIDLPIAVEP